MLAAPPFFALLPVQGGVGFDVDNLVGLAIVFFAVIWPVIRGLLNVAKSNRQDHQAKARGGQAQSRPSALDEFLKGLTEDDEDDEDDEELARERRAARLARERRRATELEELRERREQAQRQQAQQEQLRAAPVTDPFDSVAERQDATASLRDALEVPSSARAASAMEAVDGFNVSIDDELDEVPSESELEEGRFVLGADSRRTDSGRAPDEEGLEVLAGEGERAAFSLGSVAQSPLDRVQGGRSPWQSAILMKEILGPPISVTPHDDQLL